MHVASCKSLNLKFASHSHNRPHVEGGTAGSAEPYVSRVGCLPSNRALRDQAIIRQAGSHEPSDVVLNGHEHRYIVISLVVPRVISPLILIVVSESRSKNSAPSPWMRKGVAHFL